MAVARVVIVFVYGELNSLNQITLGFVQKTKKTGSLRCLERMELRYFLCMCWVLHCNTVCSGLFVGLDIFSRVANIKTVFLLELPVIRKWTCFLFFIISLSFPPFFVQHFFNQCFLSHFGTFFYSGWRGSKQTQRKKTFPSQPSVGTFMRFLMTVRSFSCFVFSFVFLTYCYDAASLVQKGVRQFVFLTSPSAFLKVSRMTHPLKAYH